MRTLSGEKLEGCHDTQELMLYGGDVQHEHVVLWARLRRRTARVRFCINNNSGFLVPGHERLEHLQEIFEEVDVDEVRKLGDTPQRRRQQRCPVWSLQYAEVEHEQ